MKTFFLSMKFFSKAFGKKKDRGGLLQYISTMDTRSADYIYAENILQTMVGTCEVNGICDEVMYRYGTLLLQFVSGSKMENVKTVSLIAWNVLF